MLLQGFDYLPNFKADANPRITVTGCEGDKTKFCKAGENASFLLST